MNIANWLERSACLTPDRPALFLGRDIVASYGEFHHHALALAGALRSLGIKPGARVGIFMKNCPDYLIVQYGIWYAGAVAVPINSKLHPKEVEWIVRDAEVALVLSDDAVSG